MMKHILPLQRTTQVVHSEEYLRAGYVKRSSICSSRWLRS